MIAKRWRIRMSFLCFLGLASVAKAGRNTEAINCNYFADRAISMIDRLGAQDWEYRWAGRVCSPQALQSFREVVDGNYFEWELKWASQINNIYSREIFYIVRDGNYQEWELYWASRVNNPFALAAFKDIRDTNYQEWEMEWATKVNNVYAMNAFIEITDGLYSEWELKWSVYINTRRELEYFRRLRTRGTYTEEQLRAIALLD